MTIGTAIFLSSLLLVIVILYGLTKDRWAWQRIVKRAALVLVGLILFGGLGGVGFFAWEHFPMEVQHQTQYASIHIGMSPEEVKYVKGYPTQVFGPAVTEGEFEGSQPVIETKNIGKEKRVEDYEDWSYQGNRHRIDLQFDPDKTSVILVQCFSDDKQRRCPSIAGVSDGDSEKELIRKFGQPDSSSISGGVKSFYYSRIGVFFALTQERVYLLGINDTRYAKN